MQDPLKKVKQHEVLSEGVWDKLFGDHRNGDFTHDGKYWRIGQGVINFLENDGSLDNDEKLDFLKDSTFYADRLTIRNGIIRFVGTWKSGTFKGDYFYTSTNYLSVFEGGIFYGGYMQNVKWDAHPVRFVDGKINTHPKFGLLGLPVAFAGDKPSEISLLSVQKGQYIIFTSASGDKKSLKMAKTIDENGSEIIITILPEEKTYKLSWTALRKEYNSMVFKVGAPINLAGIFSFPDVSSIEISDSFSYQAEYKDVVPLNLVKELPLNYNLNFNLGASKAHRDQVASLRNKIESGIYGTNLRILKSDIDTAVQSGEASDLGDFIVKAKNGGITGIDTGSLDAMEDITNLINLTKKFINPQIGDRLFNDISAFLKPKVRLKTKPTATVANFSIGDQEAGKLDPDKKKEYLKKFQKITKK